MGSKVEHAGWERHETASLREREKTYNSDVHDFT
jgi:hypothetical protein